MTIATDPLTEDERAIPRSVPPNVLKRRSVPVMVLMFFSTLGLYYPIWFLRRRAGLNSLDSPRKLQLWPFVIASAWIAFQLIADPGAETTIVKVIRLPVAILMVVQAFFVKDILADHLSGPGDNVPSPLYADRVELSGLMTFVFQIFYLQHVINRYIAAAKPGA